MVTVGKNILDNLTTGMYSDSKVIYREYIQNACDAISHAIGDGLTGADEPLIDIYIDESKRYISIKDNGTGVSASAFQQDLGDIANSNKERGKDKGFRGIGRLCGLAYCKTLKFTTSALGEDTKSIMVCDAKKMRYMLNENKKYTLADIWSSIVSYESLPEKSNEHYFEVELIDINQENTDLLNSKKIRDYLSFVAPVPYKNTFILRNQIYDHAKAINYAIDEYCIKVNGSQIFKEYTTRLKEESGNTLKIYDEISQLYFHDLIDDNGQLLGWIWIGLSRFEKQIPKINQMRGLRLRSANIQLGEDDVLKDLFKELRGNYYFIGEVFATSKQLIPNSQRNYFNENETRVDFEDKLREYFFDVLHKLYSDANKIKNAYKRQEELISIKAEFEKKESESGFIDDGERQKILYRIKQAQKDAEDARRQLDKFKNIDETSPIAIVHKSIGRKYDADALTRKAAETEVPNAESGNKKKGFVTATFSRLSRSERKLVGRILSIITDIAPQSVAEQLINKIKEEFQ